MSHKYFTTENPEDTEGRKHQRLNLDLDRDRDRDRDRNLNMDEQDGQDVMEMEGALQEFKYLKDQSNPLKCLLFV